MVQENNMANWFRNLINFIRLLTVEPLAFLTIFIYLLKTLPQDQMVQDKICLQKYNLPDDYCHHLPTMKDDEDTLYHMKSTILSDVTQFKLYVSILITIPIMFISVIIGPFIDKYKPAKRILLIISSLVSILEISILVYNSYFFSTSNNNNNNNNNHHCELILINFCVFLCKRLLLYSIEQCSERIMWGGFGVTDHHLGISIVRHSLSHVVPSNDHH